MKKLSKVQKCAIQEAMRRMEQDHNLSIRWIRTKADLRKAEQGGFFKLYQQVFADPPYNEDFSVEQIRGFFEEALDAGGLVFTASVA